MVVIGVDTASRVGGVAIVRDGALIAQHILGVEEGHARNLVPSLETLMSESDIRPDGVDGLSVSVGQM